MSERYWITGVQLGCLIALQHTKTRQDLVDEIIDKQFLGNKKIFEELLKDYKIIKDKKGTK